MYTDVNQIQKTIAVAALDLWDTFNAITKAIQGRESDPQAWDAALSETLPDMEAVWRLLRLHRYTGVCRADLVPCFTQADGTPGDPEENYREVLYFALGENSCVPSFRTRQKGIKNVKVDRRSAETQIHHHDVLRTPLTAAKHVLYTLQQCQPPNST